jgi:hypothetical protein
MPFWRVERLFTCCDLWHQHFNEISSAIYFWWPRHAISGLLLMISCIYKSSVSYWFVSLKCKAMYICAWNWSFLCYNLCLWQDLAYCHLDLFSDVAWCHNHTSTIKSVIQLNTTKSQQMLRLVCDKLAHDCQNANEWLGIYRKTSEIWLLVVQSEVTL